MEMQLLSLLFGGLSTLLVSVGLFVLKSLSSDVRELRNTFQDFRVVVSTREGEMRVTLDELRRRVDQVESS